MSQKTVDAQLEEERRKKLHTVEKDAPKANGMSFVHVEAPEPSLESTREEIAALGERTTKRVERMYAGKALDQQTPESVEIGQGRGTARAVLDLFRLPTMLISNAALPQDGFVHVILTVEQFEAIKKLEALVKKEST